MCKVYTRSDEIFHASDLVFIAKQTRPLADTAEPEQGFRPCNPRVSSVSDSQSFQEIFPYLAMSNQASSSQHTIDRVRDHL